MFLVVSVPLRVFPCFSAVLPLTPNLPSEARGCQHSVTAACSMAAPAGLIGQRSLDLEGALSCPRSLRSDQGWQSLTVGKGLLSWAAGGLEPPFVAVEHPSLSQIAVRSSRLPSCRQSSKCRSPSSEHCSSPFYSVLSRSWLSPAPTLEVPASVRGCCVPLPDALVTQHLDHSPSGQRRHVPGQEAHCPSIALLPHSYPNYPNQGTLSCCVIPI